jgi:hypothetical protein
MSSPLPPFNSVVASARPVMPQKKLTFQYESWQDQAWDYYDRIGEFESAVNWKANSISRVRLVAAELSPIGEEPVPLEGSHPAAQAMERFAGGTGGQAQLMREITIHDSVVGEGWLVGETDAIMGERWFVASADELRANAKGTGFEIREGEDDRKGWRPLETNSSVVRVWNPHPRYGWRADSDARHAMSALLELDLISKRIIAEIVSRLSSNGILLYDKGRLSLPSTNQPPDGADQVDPFAEMLVSVAGSGINDPMSAEAVIPIPIGFDLGDATDVDPKLLMQHLTFSGAMDDKLLLERESAVKRLATSLDMPPEQLLGMGDLNHWGAWQIEESGIKIHISPTVERFAYGITTGFLHPFLQAAGEPVTGPNGRPVVVWYDPSEITVRPDRSANTIAAYDRNEVNGETLRREIGLSEDGDKPSDQDRKIWIENFLGRQPTTAAGVLAAMGGEDIQTEPTDDEQRPDRPEVEVDSQGEPNTEGDDPPSAEGVDLGALSTNDFAALYQRMTQEFDRRFDTKIPAGSTWVEAHEPNNTRVTPVKRGED